MESILFVVVGFSTLSWALPVRFVTEDLGRVVECDLAVTWRDAYCWLWPVLGPVGMTFLVTFVTTTWLLIEFVM